MVPPQAAVLQEYASVTLWVLPRAAVLSGKSSPAWFLHGLQFLEEQSSVPLWTAPWAAEHICSVMEFLLLLTLVFPPFLTFCSLFFSVQHCLPFPPGKHFQTHEVQGGDKE